MRTNNVSVACVSDIHNHLFIESETPDADILIIAGDATKRGTMTDFAIFKQNLTLWDTKYKYIVYIPGKHDIRMETHYWDMYDYLTDITSVHILINTSIILMGLKIWGSPVSNFDVNWAFTMKDKQREKVFEKIPKDTDIIVTYSPAYGILDEISVKRKVKQRIGCKHLLRALERIRPQLHVCGNAHDSYGAAKDNEITFINASLVNDEFQPFNKIPVVDVITKENK